MAEVNRTPRAPKFLLAGNGPYANRGCEAIVRGTVEMLSQRFAGASFTLSSFGRSRNEEAATETDPRIRHMPHEDYKGMTRFSREWWSRRLLGGGSGRTELQQRFKAQYEAGLAADCALLLGGDNYTLDYGRPTVFFDMDDVLMSTGKPVVMWGASVGPFTKDPEFEPIAREHLSKLDLILAREMETVSYLASIGVEENVRLVADPAFLMQPKKPELPDSLMSFIDRRPIGLNFSPLAGSYLSLGSEQWASLVVECTKALLESTSECVLLVPHVTIDSETDNDYTFLREVRQRLCGYEDRLAVLPPSLMAAEYKWVISKLSAFGGTRMHATVAAYSSAVPTLSIGYSMKSRGLNKDIFGHCEWLLPVDALTPDSLLIKMQQLLAQGNEISAALREKMPDIVSRAEKAGDHIALLLGNR